LGSKALSHALLAEIAPFTLSEEAHLLSPMRRARLRSAASDAGIGITGLHYMMLDMMLAPETLSITSSDAAQRTRS
jgi:hypothetical protein